jgi:c-di-GMP-binding flagellar brake protein YcgR
MDSHQDKGRDKRRFPRLPFKEAVKFQIGEFTSPDGSLSKDLSRGGISLTVNEFIPVKGQVIVYLQQHKEAQVVELKGIVAWVKILPESERYQIGVEFCDLDESTRREVNRIVVALD